ncbi:MAG: hypothetical protein V1676_01925 [Candidatus Diapherotrites archaeon]
MPKKVTLERFLKNLREKHNATASFHKVGGTKKKIAAAEAARRFFANRIMGSMKGQISGRELENLRRMFSESEYMPSGNEVSTKTLKTALNLFKPFERDAKRMMGAGGISGEIAIRGLGDKIKCQVILRLRAGK